MNQQTIDMLTEMKMTAMAAEFANQIQDASFNSIGFEERLSMLVTAEWNRRQNNKVARLMRAAEFGIPSAVMEEIEYHENRKLDKAQLLRLAACKYIDEGHHVEGASGNGKTYIACALGNAACRRMKTVRYIRMPELLDELNIARSNGSLKKLMKTYKKVELLILDEWLIRPLTSQESYDLLEIAEARSSRSTIFCTQYQPEGWYTRIDPDPESQSPISEAIMDRIIHNSYEILVEGRASMRERKGLEPVVEKYGEYKTALDEMDEAKELLSSHPDEELKEMAEAQFEEAKEAKTRLEEEIKILLLPRDPNDDRSVIMEIRSGAGGEEAALFAHSLYRMYTMYAESKGFKTEVLSVNETELGGIKEIEFSVEGDGAFSRLKFESGVHRVQRVPETESQGRIQTSTATVAVLPEVEDVDVEINQNDLIIETHRSGGAGGQHVNKTESAIRIIHVPTGTVVDCQDERSQYKNKEKALKILRSRIYEKMQAEQNEKIASDRRSQVGTGDRSERIRTYNFPQGRVTDHRIGLTLYKILQIMDGDLDELIDALITTDRANKLAASEDNE